MERPIVHAEFLLSRKSVPATQADTAIAEDLRDTLVANRATCVGMAANMIGELKRIIVFTDGSTPRLMYNPTIVEKKGPYHTEEGCLSLDGVRPTTRYRRITVDYQDEHFERRSERFSGFTAQIIQHEVDHCDGILV